MHNLKSAGISQSYSCPRSGFMSQWKAEINDDTTAELQKCPSVCGITRNFSHRCTNSFEKEDVTIAAAVKNVCTAFTLGTLHLELQMQALVALGSAVLARAAVNSAWPSARAPEPLGPSLCPRCAERSLGSCCPSQGAGWELSAVPG